MKKYLDRGSNNRQKWIQGHPPGNQRKPNINRTEPICFACGRRGHVIGATHCPAKQAACLSCKRIGHFARQCRKRPNRDSHPPPPAKRIRVVQDTDAKNDKQSDYIFYAMGTNTFLFPVGGMEIPMVIDSGAAANIISYSTWIEMKRKGVIVRDMTTNIHRALTCY